VVGEEVSRNGVEGEKEVRGEAHRFAKRSRKHPTEA
jgi:hypothetical protein